MARLAAVQSPSRFLFGWRGKAEPIASFGKATQVPRFARHDAFIAVAVARMAAFAPAGESDSDSDYGYDLTASDEELLVAIVDRLSSVSPQSRPGPATAAPHSDAAAAISIPAYDGAASRFSASAPSNSPAREAHTSHAVQDAIAALAEHDLDFDSSELEDNAAPSDRQPAAHGPGIARGSTAAARSHKLTPAAPRRDGDLSSFVSQTRPRHVPTLLPGPDVSYPDCKLPAAPRSPHGSSH